MKTIRSESETKNSPVEADEPLRGDQLDKEAAEREKPVQEVVEPGIAELVKTELEGDLKIFYKNIKDYYSDAGAGWTPEKLIDKSDALRPIILNFRNILKESGEAESDKLIGELIKAVQEMLAAKKSEHDFLDKVLDHSAMVYNSGLERFYRYIAKGLEKRTEAKSTAG